MTDEYNGWSNRETWCAELWLSNDEGTYNMVTEWATEAWGERDDREYPDLCTGEQYAIRVLADRLEAWFSDLAADMVDGETTSEEARNMLDDIGSRFRVDWNEIAEGWIAVAVEADAPGTALSP